MSEFKPKTKQDLVEIGAGWRKQTKTTNKPYLFLKLELEDSLGVGQTVLCRAFKNDFKKSDKEPDLRIFLATDRDGNVAKANPRKPYVKKEVKAEEVKTEVEKKNEEPSQVESDDVL